MVLLAHMELCSSDMVKKKTCFPIEIIGKGPEWIKISIVQQDCILSLTFA